MFSLYVSNSKISETLNNIAPDMHTMFAQMEGLWDQLNMDGETRQKRVDYVFKNFRKLIGDILCEEEKMVKQVFEQIGKAKRDLATLRALFGLPEFDESKYPRMSLALV